MAKSSRSSTKKANNRRKAESVFGPAELARNERLSAKLLELAKQPRPEPADINMDGSHGDATIDGDDGDADADDDANVMELDGKKPFKTQTKKMRVAKRNQKKSKIVFPRYSDRVSKTKRSSRTTTRE
ncbi:hypothetical protein DCS_03027 [Drechmeria coniospora]|uniref:DUF2423 domain-containing protein n=1 Tax=Drechmeria coniospora TaxID=98403 RepID=A0A151GXX2_DRECN|nr:hypothetical protein DCS_03027 [Drechmeria coniospora]KYK61883.1 hypothetical protein DCS_03027 [Drechmeria coniospora]